MRGPASPPSCVVSVAWALFAAGCELHPLADGLPAEEDCVSCHRAEEGEGDALFDDTSGDESHEAHEEAGYHCDMCHPVPERIADKGHSNGTVDVVFGELAHSGGTEPEWDPEEKECSGVYCHGSTLEDGVNTEPVWTEMSDDGVPCEGCHGMPPLNAHFPDSTDCWNCHTEVVDEEGNIIEEGGLHINGKIDM